MKKEIIQINGIVQSIIYRNDENNYTVLDLDSNSELITVVGTLPTVVGGDNITVMGHFTSHRSFGMQFQAVSWDVSMPEGVTAIKNYLSSGAVKGIGPVLAKRVIGEFGNETLDIIENHPKLLSKVKGISIMKAKVISSDFKKMFGMRNVILFLNKYDFPTNIAVKAWKEYAPVVLEMIKEDPFVLCNRNIGLPFEDADIIRKDLGFDENSNIRINASVITLLQEALRNGHSCFPLDELTSLVKSRINISNDQVEKSFEDLLFQQQIYIKKVKEINFVYLMELYDSESYIATRLSMMLKNFSPEQIDVENEIIELEAKMNIEYAKLQKKAIFEAVNNPVMILTGGPGTGKTTTLNAIISLLKTPTKKVLIAAPTGRAAKRISELTGYEAKTIHRLLGVNMSDDKVESFVHNENNPLNCDVLILDELSMVDMILFEDVLKALKFSAKLILVGDKAQLPPVGIGNTLKELINSEVIPIVELKEIFRQALESDIVKNSHNIINGQIFDLSKKEGDFFYISRNNDSDISNLLSDLLLTRLPNAYDFSPLWDIQVLCPTRIGKVGTIEMNRVIQEKINPPKMGEAELKNNFAIFRQGDKVMQIKNNYEIIWRDDEDNINETGVFNGDIGQITLIDKIGGIFEVNYDDKTAIYQSSQINEIEHAYAITVHKSQGSEFEAVIMPVTPYLGRMAYRNLLYTAVTRAKQLMVIVGSYQAIEKMILNADKTSKYTNLSEFLKISYDIFNEE